MLNLNGVFTHLFEKGKNVPPISKPCLLVISRNRKKAFQGLKKPKNLTQSRDSQKWDGGRVQKLAELEEKVKMAFDEIENKWFEKKTVRKYLEGV